jgi:hypothetical protein
MQSRAKALSDLQQMQQVQVINKISPSWQEQFASSALMFVLTIAFGGIICCQCLTNKFGRAWVLLGIVDSCFPCRCTTLFFDSGNACNLIQSSMDWFRAGPSGIDLIASIEQKLGTIWI